VSQSSFSTLTCCILGLAAYEANRFTAYAMSGLVAFTSNCSAFRRRGRLCFGNALPFQLDKSIIFDTVGKWAGVSRCRSIQLRNSFWIS